MIEEPTERSANQEKPAAEQPMFERSWSTWWRHMVFDDGFVIYAGGATWTLVSGEGLRDTGTAWMTTFAVLAVLDTAACCAPAGVRRRLNHMFR